VAAFFMFAGQNPFIYLMPGLRSSTPNKKGQSLLALPFSFPFFRNFLYGYCTLRRANPASPAKPAPKRSMVAGSGTGAAFTK
jgi:hypothetical protein